MSSQAPLIGRTQPLSLPPSEDALTNISAEDGRKTMSLSSPGPFQLGQHLLPEKGSVDMALNQHDKEKEDTLQKNPTTTPSLHTLLYKQPKPPPNGSHQDNLARVPGLAGQQRLVGDQESMDVSHLVLNNPENHLPSAPRSSFASNNKCGLDLLADAVNAKAPPVSKPVREMPLPSGAIDVVAVAPRKRKISEGLQDCNTDDVKKNVSCTDRERKRKKCTQEGCNKLARQDQRCQQHYKEYHIKNYLEEHPEMYVNKDGLDSFIRIGRGSGSNQKDENKGYLKLMIFKRPEYKASKNKNLVAKAAKEEAEQKIGPFLDQLEGTKRWFKFPEPFAVEKCRTFISQGHLPDWYVEDSEKKFMDTLRRLQPEYQRASTNRKEAIARLFLDTIESKVFRVVDFEICEEPDIRKPTRKYVVLSSEDGLKKCSEALEGKYRDQNTTVMETCV